MLATSGSDVGLVLILLLTAVVLFAIKHGNLNDPESEDGVVDN